MCTTNVPIQVSVNSGITRASQIKHISARKLIGRRVYTQHTMINISRIISVCTRRKYNLK